MCFITKATSTCYIDSKCHINKLKSSKICLIGYSNFISREWFSIAWHTCILSSRTKAISRNQVRAGQHMSGLKFRMIAPTVFLVGITKNLLKFLSILNDIFLQILWRCKVYVAILVNQISMQLVHICIHINCLVLRS